MSPTEEQIATAVRAALARHLASHSQAIDAGRQPIAEPGRPHPSFALLQVAPGSDGDGACLIEPAVACHHCGFCLSFGH
jgi:hypothetical protein